MAHAHIVPVAFAIGLVLIAGCATPEGRLALSADHPANPEANEAPFTPPPNLLVQPVNPAPAASPVPGKREVFTCPMHPDLRMPGPGKCQMCGMTLEPMAAAESSPQEVTHDHRMAM